MEERSCNWPQRMPIYYGWICVFIAAGAMTATLPGRTHGLGLITVPMLADLGMSDTLYARITLVCTLIGATFCIPAGFLLDRLGVRKTLSLVVALLGVSVLAMARATGPLSLFISLVFVRGLGQSALSVVSMSIVGKWFRRRLSVAMGVFAVLLTIGFIVTILSMESAISNYGWRNAWTLLGVSLLVFLPVAWLLTRDTPESCGVTPDDPAEKKSEEAESVQVLASSDGGMTWEVPPDEAKARDLSFSQAIRTPAFWIFAGGAASFNLVWSGITLFNESIIGERGFDAKIAGDVLAILAGCGLIANIVAGALATRERLGKILAAGLGILALTMAGFPLMTTQAHIWIYAVAMGLTGGIVTVIFFAAWGHLFGRTHLGKIQGLAQIVTVLASATGPILFAETKEATASYTPVFYALAGVAGLMAVAAFFVRPPAMAGDAEGSE